MVVLSTKGGLIMDFKEFIQDKANKLVALDWPDDMILVFIDGAEQTKKYFDEKTNNTINVSFRKEQDGWHAYTQYGIDLPTSTAIEFGEHIAKAVNLLNGKEVTNE